ncbi:coiled-coil domain-containing protein 86 [Belonocnema kinseyi]|uniref:coiled-coil domain-containing protein 86 n=1 Tax=Belonocnema kinseyi TaxID=2817044 RepID=UPI00143E0649|nr:coiled-coil domain-containing protein 86 [Belonocnema kinseyi]
MTKVSESNIESRVQNIKTLEKKSKKKAKNDQIVIPRGKPKSGRIWKEQKTRFSSIVKTRGIRQSFEQKQKLREHLKHIKEISREKKAKMKEEKELKKQRRIEKLKREEENRKKSEVVQVITNTAKIKRMKKKQLRMVEKRDTLKM